MNLILIVIDSLRKDHVGAYGNLPIVEWMQDLIREDAGGDVPVLYAPLATFDKKE